MTIAAGLDVSADALTAICRKYHVRELSVFGSAARGEMREDSDVDLLVEFEPGAAIGWEFFDLEIELSRLFGRKVDMGERASLKPRVRPSALRDARVIYSA
jgi:hypothetical protein